MTRCFLLATLAALAVACRAPEPGSLRLDPSSELDAATRSASARLEAATGVAVPVSEGEGMDLRVAVRLAPDSALAPATKPEGCGSCTWTGHFDGQTILINADAVRAEDLERTVLHETIHAVILAPGKHLAPGVEGVMSPAGGVDCLTAPDLEIICGAVECTRFVPETCR